MLRLGYSRRMFIVAEAGPWNAKDVVQGAFSTIPGISALSWVFISAFRLDSVGDHSLRKCGYYQVMVGTLRNRNPARHRNLSPGAHRFEQGRQEAFPLTYPPRFSTSNRRPVCTHPAPSAHHPPSESFPDTAFTYPDSDRQSSLHAVYPVSRHPHSRHVFEDESPLGTYRVLLSG